jgi:hypothetical protein
MTSIKGLAGMAMDALGFGPELDEKGYYDGQTKGFFTGYTTKGKLTNMEFLKKNKDRRNYLKQIEKVIAQEKLDKAEAKAKLDRLAAEELALAQGKAPGGGTWQGGSPAYSYNGQGGGQFTDSQGNQDYNDPYDSGGGEKDGGYIDGTNRRKDFKNGGFSVLGSSSMTDAVMKRIEALMDEGLDFGSAYTQVKKEAPALAHGGRVGAKDGGSMIQIVKDRLMEKNPAMWGLGYEGLASLQDLIMSMPFNQGGIVNIRRR